MLCWSNFDLMLKMFEFALVSLLSTEETNQTNRFMALKPQQHTTTKTMAKKPTVYLEFNVIHITTFIVARRENVRGHALNFVSK